MAVAGILEIQMRADVARLADDMSQAKGHVSLAMSSIESSVASAKSALAALGIGLSVGYFANLIKGTIDAQAHLEALTHSTSLTVQELAGLTLLAKETGSDVDGLAKALDKMSVAMGKNPEKFKELGVTAKDNKGALMQLSDIFNQLTDVQQRNALAQNIFGKAWAEVAPVLALGGDEIGKIIDKGAALSGITEESARQAKLWNTQMAELETTLGSTKNKLVGDLLEPMNDIAQAMREAAKESGLLMTLWVGFSGIVWKVIDKTPAQELAGINQRLADDIGELRSNVHLTVAEIKQLADNIARLETLKAAMTPSAFAGAAAGAAGGSSTASARAAAFLGTKAAAEASDALYKAELENLAKEHAALTGVGEMDAYITKLEETRFNKLSAAQLADLLVKKDIDIQLKKDIENRKLQEESDKILLEAQQKLRDMVLDYAAALRDQQTEEAFGITLIGKSQDETAKLIALHKLDLDLKKELNKITQDGEDMLMPEQVAAMNRMIALNAAAKAGIGITMDHAAAVRNEVSAWTEVSAEAGKFFGDLVMNGKSAFDNLKTYLKSFLQQLIALFAQRWILQIAAGATGSAALGNAAASVGSGTLSGAASSGIGSYLGSTAVGSYFSAAGSNFMMGFQSGMAAPGATLAESFGANLSTILANPVTWYAAVIAVGVAANANYYNRGYTTANNPGIITPETTADRILQALGMGSSGASNLSGSSGINYLFGHGGTHADAGGIRGNITGDAFSGTTFQDYSQRGGVFSSDRRWTDTAAMTAGQSKPFNDAMVAIHDQMTALGNLLGVDAGKLLENYTKQMDIWLTNKTPAEAQAAIADFFNTVFVEQVGIVAGAAKGPAGAFIADFIKNFTGTTQALTDQVSKYLTALAQLVDVQRQITDAIRAVNDPLGAFKNQIEGLDKAVTDSNAAFDAALKTADPTVILTAEQALQTAIVNRYTVERDLLAGLVAQIAQLKQSQFQFSLSLAQSYNAAGGNFDTAGFAAGHATDIRNTLPAITDPALRISAINDYVTTIGASYQASVATINAGIAAQNTQAQAAATASNTVNQARISAAQTELQLVQQWTGVLGQAKTMLDSMRLTNANPLSSPGQLALASGDTSSMFAQFQSSTGSAQVALAGQLLPALQTQLGLLQANSQRPSAEYQAGYNSIIAMVTAVQAVAQTQDDRVLGLQQQIADLQAQGNAIAQVFSATNSAQMDALNAQYRDQLVFANTQGRLAYDQQQVLAQAQINAITGGMDVNLYQAQILTNSLAALRSIDARLGDYLNGPPIAMPKPGSGSASGLAPVVNITVHAPAGDSTTIATAVAKVIEQRLPQIKRALQTA